MRPKKTIKMRMCVQCKERILQERLVRLQFLERSIVPFRGVGRSFYVCKTCTQNEPFYKHMMGRCNVPKNAFGTFREQLKEIVANG